MQVVDDNMIHLDEIIRAEDFAAQQISKAADEYARAMDNMIFDIEDMDPVACPPDRRIPLGDREAWVYHHGNICDLLFVNLS